MLYSTLEQNPSLFLPSLGCNDNAAVGLRPVNARTNAAIALDLRAALEAYSCQKIYVRAVPGVKCTAQSVGRTSVFFVARKASNS